MSGPLVGLFAVQGEGTEEEQRRKEQMKKTGKELQAQKEDNERRIMRERHRGRKKDRSTHWNNTDEPCCAPHTATLIVPPSLPPHTDTYKHSHAQPCTAGGLDGWTFIPDGFNDACTGCVTNDYWGTMATSGVECMKERKKSGDFHSVFPDFIIFNIIIRIFSLLMQYRYLSPEYSRYRYLAKTHFQPVEWGCCFDVRIYRTLFLYSKL